MTSARITDWLILRLKNFLLRQEKLTEQDLSHKINSSYFFKPFKLAIIKSYTSESCQTKYATKARKNTIVFRAFPMTDKSL
jgi:hypothetical protein